MGRKARQRGHEWERQVARDLGQGAKRTYEEREGQGRDISTDLPFCIQCKAGKKPSVHKALNEACDAASETEYAIGAVKWSFDSRRDPVDNRSARRVAIMRWDDLLELIDLMKANGLFE